MVLPIEPDRKELLQQWLTQTKSTKVEIRVPQRGDKRELHDLVTLNAKQELNRHRLRRAADHTARSRALSELQDLLGLPEAPLRIECYDMAHLQGTDYVGSMVVLEDGLPLKRDYRKFKIKSGQGNDDYAAMREVLTRRLSAYIKERDQPISERGERPGK
ncbi:MAG: excinuclease ABC subunit C, partial [Acidimicrobiaceae bacterium]